MDVKDLDFSFDPLQGTFSIGGDTQEEPQAEPARPVARTSIESVGSTVRRDQRERPEEAFDGSLTQSDLLDVERLDTIRNYMIDYKGVDYRDASPEQVVDDFMEHMRWFNANIVSTGGVATYLANATDEQKARAADAYELYDQLGNVFVNDGFYGAVEGVGDYIFATAADPSTWIGLLTGGLAKGAATGTTQATRAAMQAAARAGRTRATSAGATRVAADAAADEAARRTAARLAQNNVNSATSRRVAAQVANQERDLALRASRQARREAARAGARQTAERRALYQTTALDGSFAALHDNMIQNVMLDVGVQENYSLTQTAFSSAFGLIGGGLQLAGRQARGASRLENAPLKIKEAEARAQQEALVRTALDDDGVKRATKIVQESIDSWVEKVQRGRDQFDPAVTPTDFIAEVMFGPDGVSGLRKLFQDKGIKIQKGFLVSDVMTSVTKQLPQETLQAINDKLQKNIGITLGDTTEMGVRLGDLLAKDINQAARTLNLASRFKRSLDASVMHGTNITEGILANQRTADAIAKEKKRMSGLDPIRYGQSVWRRLLVSSPATSMVNLQGFGQFLAGQSVADLLSSTALTFAGVATMPISRSRGKELMRMGRVYREIQAQKIRNFADPFTTKDAYMALLQNNKTLNKALFESFAGGVDRAVAKFGVDPDAKWFKGLESFTEGANNVTGVRIQDSFTKSQMFMTELDKNLRLVKGRELFDVLESGTLDEIDDEVIGLTLDTTLKSVFSKDYTTDDQLLSEMAAYVEKFSNLPGFGTILPFGRFFNNVVGTVYQWGPMGFLTPMKAVLLDKGLRGKTLGKSGQVALVEATARAAVGTTALGLAMKYDQERRDKGLAWNEIPGSGGTIIDARNTFPLSFYLALGRWGNMWRNDEEIPTELTQEALAQMAVGQFARDVEFGTDLVNLVDTISKLGSEESRATLDGVWRGVGGVVAGFSRPLDPVNRLIGFMDNTDAARDLRQAQGGQAFTQSATRYVDNIFEALFGQTEAVTGNELRVATRQGPVRDPNVLARIFGVTVKPSRTSTERVYSLADLPDWTASQRSNMPEYDTIFQELIAPRLERAAEQLERDRRFIEGDAGIRGRMLKNTLSRVRSDVREYMERYSDEPETRLLALQRQARRAGSSNAIRREAMRTIREQGVEADIGDMGFRELQYYLELVDYLDDYYRDRTR